MTPHHCHRPALLLGLLLGGCGGADAPAPSPDPAGMVHLTTPGLDGTAGDFWIDRYEFPNQAGTKPRVYTHAIEARAACEAEGKRLCTAAEWRRACAGPEGSLRFGYGPRYEAGRCHASHTLQSGHTSMMDPEEQVAASGAFAKCTTPEGVVDLVGNVEEWVEDDWRGVDAMLEGGAWYTYADYADCSGDYSRHPDYRLRPDKEVYSAGFRCCWSETAPTPLDRRADQQRRLQRPAALPDYEPSNEVALTEGVFIDTYEYPNRPGERPLAAVDQREAAALCDAAGKRLCSAAEWELACAGPAQLRYPYGDRLVKNACPVEVSALPPSGSYFACTSPSGAADMVGSLWEWTATPLDAPVLKGRPDEVLRELRGGSWKVDPRKAACRATDGYPAAPEDAAFPDVGFRCCRGPELELGGTAATGPTACPAGMVSLEGSARTGPFCVDRKEYPNGERTWPKADLTLDAAVAACSAAGKHLCTEAEWMQACSGPEARRWPYGNTYDPAACHDNAEGERGGGGHPVQSGYRKGCVTPEGVVDLSGNVWEWTLRTRGAGRGATGVLHGGGWNLSAGLNQCRSTAEARASYQGQSGARCCASPDEAAALIAAGSPVAAP